jgi:trimethylamine---corrinoid protein Co-methyltransferase
LVVKGARIKRPFQILDEDALSRVDRASMDILGTTGIRFRDELALRVFQEAGAKVDFSRENVRISETLLRSCLKKAPSEYMQCARNPDNDVSVGGDEIHMRGGSGQIYVIDSVLKTRRPPTLEDLQNGTRLMDGLKNIHLLGAPGTGCWVTPHEAPPQIRDLYAWRTLFEYSEKPVSAWIYNEQNARYVIKMGEAVAGSLEDLRKRPLVGFECEATSPLQYGSETLKIMQLMVTHGLPVLFAPIPMAGATAPVTLAGTLALGNAEVLAGIALAQLLNPGTPCVYGCYGSSFDMRSALTTYGGSECILIQAGMVQLARSHQLPCAANSGTTDSKTVDSQEGFDTGLNFGFVAFAGANLSGTVGQLGVDQGASIEQLVIADEMAAVIYRIIEGIRVDQETLALDVIDKVGPGGSFLGQRHTLSHFREEHLIPSILDRWHWAHWKENGGKDLATRAREKAESILREHWPSPLDRDVSDRLEALLVEAQRNI